MPKLKVGDHISSPWIVTQVQRISHDRDSEIWVTTTKGTRIALKYFLSLFGYDGEINTGDPKSGGYWVPVTRPVPQSELDQYKPVDRPA